MKRCAALICFCLPWLCSAALLRADLNDEVNAILHDKSLAKVETGLEIVQLGTSIANSRVMYRHNSDIPLTPASNLKVVTTSAALDRLGADFKFRTQLVYHNGDLILIGDGDPSFGDAELLTRVGWDVTTVFKNWAQQISQLKLGPIKSVVVDDSIFDEQFFHPNWPADQRLNRYEAEVAGMNLNMNCLDVFVRPTRPGAGVSCITNPPTHYIQIENECVTGDGKPSMTRAIDGNKIVLHGKSEFPNEVPISISIHDGSMYAATVLNETLAAAGVRCEQSPRRDRSVRAMMTEALKRGDTSWQTIAVHETPLTQVMARANKDSMNLYGECLCKRLGAYASGQPGSWENGTAAVGEFLTGIGVPANEFHLDDGCGLSKENVISASAMATVLVHNYFSPEAKIFIDSLSVAGQDGTLNDRFPRTSLRGRVFGKTGTVNGVSCLSGYLNAQDGHCYAFSILMNKSYAGAGKPTQEKIVAAIDNGKLAAAR
jgi:D-alanyl-D-alanine carboxypeptidase/D-alanyl-D-alanine-endopeptidase (penicillin-binding protein 4)